MFTQAFRGKVDDPSAARAAMEEWLRHLKPGAEGYLGSTGGVAADGTLIMIVRFSSEESARANSDRPEQGEWWEKTMSKVFSSPPSFYDCPEVHLFRGGGSDEAGFVQVMVYKTLDRDVVRRMTKDFEKLADLRPEIIGGATAIAADGTTFDTGYFTSEAEAREGEKKDLPPDVQKLFEELGKAIEGTEYIDLSDPWLDSA